MLHISKPTLLLFGLIILLSACITAQPSGTQPVTPGADTTPIIGIVEPTLTGVAYLEPESTVRVIPTPTMEPSHPAPSLKFTPISTQVPEFTLLHTANAQDFYTWTRFLDENLDIEIDYPTYFGLSPFSDHLCGPSTGIDPINGNPYLMIGDGFLVFNKALDTPNMTLADYLQATLTELSTVGYTILSSEQGEIDGIAATIIRFQNPFGRSGALVNLIRKGAVVSISVTSDGQCAMFAEQQGHADALTEYDMLERIFDTLRFIN